MEKHELDFSVIIPTYHREPQLKVCLQSLAAQDYAHERFEVIVVDDGSGSPPNAVVENLQDRLKVKLIVQEHAGPAAARNTGAAQARAKYLVFTDDDCAFAPDWLRRMRGIMMDGDARFAAGGHTVNAEPNVYSEASQVLIDYLYDYFNSSSAGAKFFTSNNVVFPAALFLKIGGFDTSFPLNAGEDRELCDRWLHYQLHMKYVPDAIVHHHHQLTMRKFFRQHFNYGRGAHRFHQVRAARDRQRIRLEPLRFYWNLIRFPFRRFSVTRSATVSSLMVLSQFANLAGFLWEKFSALRRNP